MVFGKQYMYCKNLKLSIFFLSKIKVQFFIWEELYVQFFFLENSNFVVERGIENEKKV